MCLGWEGPHKVRLHLEKAQRRVASPSRSLTLGQDSSWCQGTDPCPVCYRDRSAKAPLSLASGTRTKLLLVARSPCLRLLTPQAEDTWVPHLLVSATFPAADRSVHSRARNPFCLGTAAIPVSQSPSRLSSAALAAVWPGIPAGPLHGPGAGGTSCASPASGLLSASGAFRSPSA